MKKKSKKADKPDKKFTSLESLKYKGITFEVGFRYRMNKPLHKMKLDQLVELVQFQSETSAKIQSVFDHSNYVVSLSDLYGI